MPEIAKTSPAAAGIGIGIGVLTLLIWAFTVTALTNISGSDAAGNALSQAFAAIALILLWVMLAVVALIGYAKGAMPPAAALAALILIPVSGIVSMAALDLLARPYVSPFYWPIIIPALIPPLVVAFSIWALLPSMRVAIPARYAAGGVWGLTLLLCVLIFPLQQMRNAVVEQQQIAIEKYDADLASLPTDSPLWAWTPFLATRSETKRGEVLGRIRRLESRQHEAELMLDRGDFPIGFIGSMDLTPSPSLCDKARDLLRQRAAALVPAQPDTKPYAVIAVDVADAVAAMNWLIGYDCSCDAESVAWETMAKAYKGTNFDIYRLAEIRDPKNLGRALREHPTRFSMLTPKAHLKAWLSFADDKEFRDQALVGARKLDHRTADAVDMLGDKYDISAPWSVLKYLPVLDLETTAPLCAAALKQVRGDLSKVHRPKADDARPYSELLDRLGAYQPLTALTWLAGHGCDAEAELSDAEAVVRSYQDTAGRAAMLATLAQLRRKPTPQ